MTLFIYRFTGIIASSTTMLIGDLSYLFQYLFYVLFDVNNCNLFWLDAYVFLLLEKSYLLN